MKFSLRRRLCTFLAAVPAALMAGCASAPKPPPKPPLPAPRPPPAAAPPPPVTLKVMIGALANVNPDVRNRPSPVTVRVYGLRRPALFESADFFALYEKDKETLGADLVDKEEFQLKPGERRQVEKPLPPEFAYVAVFAAFRDLERAQWRAVTAIIPKQTNSFEIRLEHNNATIVRN